MVSPESSAVVTVTHRWNLTDLKAHGNEDIDTWGPGYLWGEFDKYTWNITVAADMAALAIETLQPSERNP
jgi:hypothetical protein